MDLWFHALPFERIMQVKELDLYLQGVFYVFDICCTGY